MSGPIRLRPARAEDQPFLFRVYASTREEELARTGWSEAEKETFLRMQHEARARDYRVRFPDLDSQIILDADEPVGRLLVDRAPDEIRVVDLAILCDRRNRGIGGALLRAILAEAAASGKPVRIHVEHFNPAQRLYRRLGFVAIGQTGLYDHLEWSNTTSPGLPGISGRTEGEKPTGSG